jgi:hypothetical protein
VDVIEPQPTTAQDTTTLTSLRELIGYQHWGVVPWTLASNSQLAKPDFTRKPSGPLRAWVRATAWNDKDTRIELNSVADSTGQLATARRRSSAVRMCGTAEPTASSRSRRPATTGCTGAWCAGGSPVSGPSRPN